MKSLHSSFDDRQFFKSGLSVGKGLTYALDTRTCGNRTFMDTPGLEDIRMRKEAASAITKALRCDGYYQIVFVVTLEAGRVRTVDSATMNLVLNNAPEITHFGLIINKLSNRLYDRLQIENEKDALLDEFMLQIDRNDNSTTTFEKPIPIPLLLKKLENLDDFDDVIAQIPDLEKFMRSLPPITIRKENVCEIPGDTTLEKIVKQLEVKLSELKADNYKLHEQIAKDRAQFQVKLDQIMENEHRRHKEEIEELRRCYNEVVMKEQEARKAHVAFIAEENAKAQSELLNQLSKEIDENKQEICEKMNYQKQFYEDKLVEQQSVNRDHQDEITTLAQKLQEAQQKYKEMKARENATAKKSLWSKVKALFVVHDDQSQQQT